MDHTSTLRRALEDHSAVVVVGTGVSAASVSDHTNCSWPGLLKSGVQYLDSAGLLPHIAIKKSIEEDIKIGSALDPTFLLAAAQKIFDQMGGINSPHFATFLADSVGTLILDDSKSHLAKTLGHLNVPLMTTNYDTLLEQATGRAHVTWRETRRFRSALTRTSNDVFHLHGIWDDPESIILTTSDYGRIVSDVETQALRGCFGIMNTLIFVGFGSGINDPHFSALWNWLQPLTSGATHYALCLETDLQTFAQHNLHNSVIAVPYGTEHKELPTFLGTLTNSRRTVISSLDDPSTFSQVGQTCRLQILDSLSDTAVIMKPTLGDSDQDQDIDDLVIEPILLPVPPEQFAHERAKEHPQIEKLLPISEVMNNRFIALVGEEQSGLTTALSWAVIKKSDAANCIPIVLDYHQLGSGHKMVQNALRKHLRGAGAPLNKKEALPHRIALAIDNVTASNETDVIRLVNDLIALDLELVVFGCRPQMEIRLQRLYTHTDKNVSPAYLGRLGRSGAIELARRVDPVQATSIADRVLAIAHKEGLSRTPLSVTLLIIGVLSDEGWINVTSNTSFVDSFVDSLLGRGSIRDDMHLQIDSGGYSRVLEALSKRLIADDSASIGHLDLVNFIQTVVSSLDWSDDPPDIVRSLVYKGILVNRGGSVKFRQSAYLHIFAARAARADSVFLSILKRRPLYYATIIRNYAALQRDDEALVKWAHELLSYLHTEETPVTGIFRSVDETEIAENARGLEQLADKSNNDDRVRAGTQADATSTESGPRKDGNDSELDVEVVDDRVGDTEEEAEDDPYDRITDTEREPFPSTDLANAPIDIRMFAELSLVSNILRDSELVENPTLKEPVLVRTLEAWGLYMNYLHESPNLESMVTSIAEVIGNRIDLSEEQRKLFKERLIEGWAMYHTYGGIAEDLATIKLRRALDRVTTDSDNYSRVHLVLPALLLGVLLGSDAWDATPVNMLMMHHKIRASRVFVNVFVRALYHGTRSGSTRSERLETLIADFVMSDHPELSGARRSITKSNIVSALRKARSQAQLDSHRSTKRLAAGAPADGAAD